MINESLKEACMNSDFNIDEIQSFKVVSRFGGCMTFEFVIDDEEYFITFEDYKNAVLNNKKYTRIFTYYSPDEFLVCSVEYLTYILKVKLTK